ncbi:hypothetical protein EOE48_05125 [Methylobacterium oryzihabitans]|uniref:Uncharacterized protein n=1 Tax=Methylobacterium oryzihabitans TaxID=2499852 RepID=A0A437PF30_9HYPH|nr:hypothetical protein EOE48_05125 [Methylobacterium oryzihabitans]
MSSPRGRGEGRRHLVVSSASGGGARVRGWGRKRLLRKHPLTLALRARCLHDKVQTALSPPAGRGDTRAFSCRRIALHRDGRVR